MQTQWVAERLGELCRGLAVDVHVVKTTGDRVQARPLAEIGVTGVFTKELDHALLERRIDVAVHSLKDVPTTPAQGVCLAAIPEREDPRDAFVGKDGLPFNELPAGAQVGTGSLRRRALLLALRADLKPHDIRGNIDTRLRKLCESTTLAGIILALAGVRRLGLGNEVTGLFDISHWLPAPGQGALAIASRTDDGRVRKIVAALDHPPTRAATTAERAVLERLGGGCHAPIGAYAQVQKGRLVLDGFIADPSGGRLVRRREVGEPEEAHMVGSRLGERLLAMGGTEILAAVAESKGK